MMGFSAKAARPCAPLGGQQQSRGASTKWLVRTLSSRCLQSTAAARSCTDAPSDPPERVSTEVSRRMPERDGKRNASRPGIRRIDAIGPVGPSCGTGAEPPPGAPPAALGSIGGTRGAPAADFALVSAATHHRGRGRTQAPAYPWGRTTAHITWVTRKTCDYFRPTSPGITGDASPRPEHPCDQGQRGGLRDTRPRTPRHHRHTCRRRTSQQGLRVEPFVIECFAPSCHVDLAPDDELVT